MARALILGRLCLTTCEQPAGAPFVDRCVTRTGDGRRFRGRAIVMRPWRRDGRGTRGGRAVVVAWREPAIAISHVAVQAERG